MTTTHEVFIREAIHLAEQAVQHGNHPFGALLVNQGQVLLRAENTVNSGGDVTHHAELNLVSRASQQFSPEILSQCTLYTSTEPCAMCSGAIYWAGIPTVVFACSNQTLGQIATGNLAISSQEVLAQGSRLTEVIGPILEEEAVRIHQDFW
jgi:tRNA(Arg) A34 adenosine deaminase TadA